MPTSKIGEMILRGMRQILDYEQGRPVTMRISTYEVPDRDPPAKREKVPKRKRSK